MIDPDVVRILYRLKHEGYQAYVVGGAIRDILRGEHEPKDFDIATDARPMELRRLFRNSRIIGRRFRLVHIFFGQMFPYGLCNKAIEIDIIASHLD